MKRKNRSHYRRFYLGIFFLILFLYVSQHFLYLSIKLPPLRLHCTHSKCISQNLHPCSRRSASGCGTLAYRRPTSGTPT